MPGSQSESDLLLPQVVRAATKKLFITDVTRNQLFATLTTFPSFAHADTPWWKGNLQQGRRPAVYRGSTYFDEQAKTYVFSISLPIMDSLRYEVVGFSIGSSMPKNFSPSTHPIRFWQDRPRDAHRQSGIVLSCPILPTGVRLSDPDTIPHVTGREPGWVTADSDGHGGQGTA